MNEQIILWVEVLKNRINQNFEIIKENEEVIKNLIMQSSITNRSELISKSYNINHKLKDEIQDLTRIQVELVNYLNKFKEVLKNHTNEQSEPSNSDENENPLSNNIEHVDYSISFDDEKVDDELIFTQTIMGDLIFESSHPKFFDEVFFKKLLNHYTEYEYYEMCSLLLKLKGIK